MIVIQTSPDRGLASFLESCFVPKAQKSLFYTEIVVDVAAKTL